MNDICDALGEAMERPFENIQTRCYIVSALMKLVAQHGVGNDGAVDEIINKFFAFFFGICLHKINEKSCMPK